MRQVATFLVMLSVLLSGCASSGNRSQLRWINLRNGSGPHATWAQCVDVRSRAYVDRDKPASPPPWFKGSILGHPKVVFNWVLSDCADKMVGPGWDDLPPKEFGRLLGDAYRQLNTTSYIQALEPDDFGQDVEEI